MQPADPNLEMDFTLESEKSGVVEEPPFNLLVLGDWSGAATKKALDSRRPIEIDRDNFDDVMNGLGVRLDLELEAGRVELEFNSLEDFHPDELYRKIPMFGELRDLRKRLRNPDTFNSAAREVREWSAAPESEPAASDVTSEPETPSSEGLLDAILSKPEGGGNTPKGAVSLGISNLVNEIVRPHLVRVDENDQSAMLYAVDEAVSALMRSLLHDRHFQQLEAAWRGLFFLVRRTDTDSDLKIYLLDVTKEELMSDMKSESPSGSAILKLLSTGPGGDPWAAWIGNFAFESEIDDVAALIRLAKAGAASRTPFISHIRPDLLGVASLADHPDPGEWDLSGASDAGKLWAALRGLQESRFLGLVMPRFLARLPYGSETEPTEAFSFEEFTEGFGHDDYLWANSSFIVGQLLGQTFTDNGWQFGNEFHQDAEGLPLHLFKNDGETVYQSCAEVQLNQAAAERLTEYGIMPVVSFKNMDRVRLVRFQSVSDPVYVLQGRWRVG